MALTVEGEDDLRLIVEQAEGAPRVFTCEHDWSKRKQLHGLEDLGAAILDRRRQREMDEHQVADA